MVAELARESPSEQKRPRQEASEEEAKRQGLTMRLAVAEENRLALENRV